VIPPGVRVGAPIQSIHFDPAFYPSPLSFDAFRFSDLIELDHSGKEIDTHTEEKRRQQLSTQVSKAYIPWGYGKHACPGRWIAVQMMKLAMAHLITNYDIQPLTERPRSSPILNVLLPPTKATITIRHRVRK
jgi:cytochrome P450